MTSSSSFKEKVLLFSYSTTVLDILSKFLESRFLCRTCLLQLHNPSPQSYLPWQMDEVRNSIHRYRPQASSLAKHLAPRLSCTGRVPQRHGTAAMHGRPGRVHEHAHSIRDDDVDGDDDMDVLAAHTDSNTGARYTNAGAPSLNPWRAAPSAR